MPVSLADTHRFNAPFAHTLNPAHRVGRHVKLLGNKVYRACGEHADVRHIAVAVKLGNHGAQSAVAAGYNYPVVLFFLNFIGPVRHLFKLAQLRKLHPVRANNRRQAAL